MTDDLSLPVFSDRVGSPLTIGNRVLLLKDGPAIYKAMLAETARSRDHINMETCILEDDEVGR